MIPSYRKHKSSGQAVVTLSGFDFYLGQHGSRVSRAEYDRLVAAWLACGRKVDLESAEFAVRLKRRNTDRRRCLSPRDVGDFVDNVVPIIQKQLKG